MNICQFTDTFACDDNRRHNANELFVFSCTCSTIRIANVFFKEISTLAWVGGVRFKEMLHFLVY